MGFVYCNCFFHLLFAAFMVLNWWWAIWGKVNNNQPSSKQGSLFLHSKQDSAKLKNNILQLANPCDLWHWSSQQSREPRMTAFWQRYKMPMGRGGGGKNRETVAASLCLVFKGYGWILVPPIHWLNQLTISSPGEKTCQISKIWYWLHVAAV